jgi:RsiW-degrading membrane proteinase PrsW (M82 family)
LALLPVAAILFFIYRHDHDPEPMRTVGFAFLWGCVSVVPAILGELVVEIEDPFLDATFGVALIEEAAKLAMLMLYIWKHADFNDSFDAIVYSVTVSLGFAAVENIMYVINGGLDVAILRALFSIPGHATFAILMGYYFAKAKTHFYYGRRQQQYTYLALALMVPTLAHGIYDFLAMTAQDHEERIMLLLGFVGVIDIICIIMVRVAAKNDKPMVQDN